MFDSLRGKKVRVLCVLAGRDVGSITYIGTVEDIQEEFIKLSGKLYGDIKLSKNDIFINKKYIASILVDE